MTIMLYTWLAIIILALIVEALTVSLVAIWFVPAAILCMILEAVHVPIVLQIIVFIFITIVCIMLFSVKLRNNLQKNKFNSNSDAVIGKRAIVEETISPDIIGRVKINGLSWSAVSNENKLIEKGSAVKVLRIEGVKLICEPIIEK